LKALIDSLNKFQFLFPNSRLENLHDSNFREIFDIIRLRNKIYTSEELLNIRPYEIKTNDLISSFQEVFELGRLILVILNTIVSIERSFSELKRIKESY